MVTLDEWYFPISIKYELIEGMSTYSKKNITDRHLNSFSFVAMYLDMRLRIACNNECKIELNWVNN